MSLDTLFDRLHGKIRSIYWLEKTQYWRITLQNGATATDRTLTETLLKAINLLSK